MTSENFRKQQNHIDSIGEPPTYIDERIPTIIEKRIKGKTWENIAKDLSLTPRAIYDIRQKNEYTTYLTQYLYPKAIEVLKEDLTKEKDYPRINAYKEVFKMIRALIPKQTESRNLSVSLSLQENRESNAWIEHMTPEDFNKFQELKAHAIQRMNTPTQ